MRSGALGLCVVLLSDLMLESMAEEEKPQLLILGAQKAATTSVYMALEKHAGVCGSHTNVKGTGGKEYHIFDEGGATSTDSVSEHRIHAYQSSYHGSGCKAFLDATPNYVRRRALKPLWLIRWRVRKASRMLPVCPQG